MPPASDGGAYLVGPLAFQPVRRQAARNRQTSSPRRQAALRDAKIRSKASSCAPSSWSLPAMKHCCESSKPIARRDQPTSPPEPRDAEGAAATCAPRGLLYQRYKIRQDGTIAECKIVPPTSQNQRTIEDDLRTVVSQEIRRPKAELTALRADDPQPRPCISCATHFLRLEIEDDAKSSQNS